MSFCSVISSHVWPSSGAFLVFGSVHFSCLPPLACPVPYDSCSVCFHCRSGTTNFLSVLPVTEMLIYSKGMTQDCLRTHSMTANNKSCQMQFHWLLSLHYLLARHKHQISPSIVFATGISFYWQHHQQRHVISSLTYMKNHVKVSLQSMVYLDSLRKA